MAFVMKTRSAGRLVVLWLAVVLAVLGWGECGPAAPRCELDGLPVESLYRVRILDAVGRPHGFCCIACACAWLQSQADPPVALFVTDEASGAEIPAKGACFVRSCAVTNPATGNRIHAFADPEAAAQHAHAFRGYPLCGSEAPFAGQGP